MVAVVGGDTIQDRLWMGSGDDERCSRGKNFLKETSKELTTSRFSLRNLITGNGRVRKGDYHKLQRERLLDSGHFYVSELLVVDLPDPLCEIL